MPITFINERPFSFQSAIMLSLNMQRTIALYIKIDRNVFNAMSLFRIKHISYAVVKLSSFYLHFDFQM